MKKYILLSLLVISIIIFSIDIASNLKRADNLFKPAPEETKLKISKNEILNQALTLLKIRRDKEAQAIFEKILLEEPGNIEALWGKAEILRRKGRFKQAEPLLNEILGKNPKHFLSLNTLCYINYKKGDLEKSSKLADMILNSPDSDRESRAFAFMMLGIINSKRASASGIINKLICSGKIKCHLLKAKELAPDLPEIRLALGSFYLLAPIIIGGDLNKAIEELETAFKLAPDFATVNARLALAYKKKGLREKYKFHLLKAKTLEPDNEALKEIREYEKPGNK